MLRLQKPVTITVGALGQHRFQPGEYWYVGSAKQGIGTRVNRHLRLARDKTGGGKWHIDYLLKHHRVQVIGTDAFPGQEECAVAAQIAAQPGIAIPVPGFGSSDCTAGCQAHLFYDNQDHTPTRGFALNIGEVNHESEIPNQIEANR